MTTSRLGRLTLGILILIPLILIGLSILLFRIQNRHSRVLTAEVHALNTLLRVNRATVILDRQRLRVAQSVYLPLNHAAINSQAVEFNALFTNPNLFPRPESRQVQREILTQYREFVSLALVLPASPTTARVQEIQAQADEVVELLDKLREFHSADVNVIFQTEQEQSRISDILLLVANIAVLLLVLLGFVLFYRLTRQQAEAAALRATDKLRNEFVSFAAHELRNPASAIKTGASMLTEPDLDTGIREQIVESINRSADALSRLVLNLLAMGRLEEGRLQLNRLTVSLPVLFDELVTELEVYHPGVEQRVARKLPEARVDADPEYLKLAFSNILDNALKYAPSRSPITVTGTPRDATVLICVHDEGAGIPPEILPRIFEKYETTGEAPHSARRGIGLGLYMTRLLIQAHAGSIRAESEPGKGTTITVELPMAGSSDK